MFFCSLCRPKVTLALKSFNEIQDKHTELETRLAQLETKLAQPDHAVNDATEPLMNMLKILTLLPHPIDIFQHNLRAYSLLQSPHRWFLIGNSML